MRVRRKKSNWSGLERFDVWDSEGMFVWRWNRVDGKLWRENREENFFGVCLVGWRRRKINGGAQVFSPQTQQNVFSLKWRENWVEINFFLINKNVHVHMPLFIYFLLPWQLAVSNVVFFFFFFFFWPITCLFPNCFFLLIF